MIIGQQLFSQLIYFLPKKENRMRQKIVSSLNVARVVTIKKLLVNEIECDVSCYSERSMRIKQRDLFKTCHD